MVLARHPCGGCIDRLPLIFATAFVVLFYEGTRYSAHNEESARILTLATGITTTVETKAPSVDYNWTYFNPFVQPKGSVNDIMMAYSRSGFGVKSSRTLKRILFWNEAYGSKDYGIGFGQDGFRQLHCPIIECFTTDNRTLLPGIDQFDAIVFHLRTFNIEDLPTKRSPDQRWIFWSLESPQYNMQDIQPLNGLFNWTMTYRVDSDIVQPYGWIQPVDFDRIHPGNDIVATAIKAGSTRKFAFKKTKLVAWLVSNCQSRSQREKYANALAKYISVDIYGDCSSLRCDRDDMVGCYAMLERDYKFYLSFENSFCDDYATEKLYSILQLDLVPIVLGGANYTSLVPPFSYIDALKFKSAQELAEYLKLLDKDDALYRQYFWWKPHYRVRNHINDLKLSMCGLCSRLHVDNDIKVYEDMERWWVRDSHCKVPRPDNVFRIPTWIDKT